ncbi:MAG TPA: sulfotransferase domain-containing protein [Rhizomicrobium sp.]|jgi:hypothetical protein|nr:sulfotransferase domain-containing protein [Rhizomicrobium sp.]
MSGNLILIAGYPKSGNTRGRLFFEALTRPLGSRPAANELGNAFNGGWRRMMFDTCAPVSSAYLKPEEIDELLPDIYRRVALEAAGPSLVKVHDAAFRTRSGHWLYPPEHVSAVIYIVRHPFDVAASFAHHMSFDMETAVCVMGSNYVIAPTETRMIMPLHERIGSWSTNVASWLDETPYPLTLVRYEDLHADPLGQFPRLAGAVGYKVKEIISRAIETARFERLEAEERAQGFNERPQSSPKFFRAGKPRSWEGKLDARLRRRIVRDHGAIMKRLGYTPDGNVLPFLPKPL